MKKILSWKNIAKFLVITLGSMIGGCGIALFLEPHNLAPGGVSGIAIILANFIPVSTGIIVLCLNIPLLIVGLIKFGKEFLFSTVYATIIFSLSIDGCNWAFGSLIPPTQDLLLSSLFGGALSAVGLGLVFRNGCTTGGTDIIVKLLRSRYRHIKTGALFLCVDLVIAIVSGIVFRNIEIVLYASVAIVVSGLVMDFVIYGGNEAKLVFIVSDCYEEIAGRVLKELDIGATYLNGSGAYTNREKKIVMVAIKKHLYPNLRDIVKDLDPSAFMIVSSAKEIYGEGFQDHLKEEV